MLLGHYCKPFLFLSFEPTYAMERICMTLCCLEFLEQQIVSRLSHKGTRPYTNVIPGTLKSLLCWFLLTGYHHQLLNYFNSSITQYNE